MNDNEKNKTDRQIIWAIAAIVITLLLGAALSEFLSFNLQKEKLKTIQTALEYNIDADHIKTMIQKN